MMRLSLTLAVAVMVVAMTTGAPQTPVSKRLLFDQLFNNVKDKFGDTLDNFKDFVDDVKENNPLAKFVNGTKNALKNLQSIMKGEYKFENPKLQEQFDQARENFDKFKQQGLEKLDDVFEVIVAKLVVLIENGVAEDTCGNMCSLAADKLFPPPAGAFSKWACDPACKGAVNIAGDMAEKYQLEHSEDDE